MGCGIFDVMVWHDTDNDDTLVARRRSAREIFSRIFGYVRRYPGFAVGTMSCAIISTAAGLAFPKLTQVVIDDVISKGRSEWLLPVAGLLLLAFFLRDFFNAVRINLNNRFERCSHFST